MYYKENTSSQSSLAVFAIIAITLELPLTLIIDDEFVESFSIQDTKSAYKVLTKHLRSSNSMTEVELLTVDSYTAHIMNPTITAVGKNNMRKLVSLDFQSLARTDLDNEGMIEIKCVYYT
jgi:hypothetical protein